MSYNRENYRRVCEEYNAKYLRAREQADARRSEVYAAVPEIGEIDRELSRVGLDILKAVTGGGDAEARIAELRARNGALQERRRGLLVANGFAADYTDIRYECPLCADSGFADGRMCACMRRRLIEAALQSSGMSDLLKSQTFENFDLSYYADRPERHRHMTRVYDKMRAYAETFTAGESGSLVLFGATGLGKTHLSSAVAGKVIERGYDVYYTGAPSLLADFETQRFGGRSAEGSADTDRYFECDLLLIDDLGAEVTNQFTTSVLYRIINSRLNLRKSTIISTNLSQEEFRRRYWDRITSRVLGEYAVLPFVGTDVRAQKLTRAAEAENRR